MKIKIDGKEIIVTNPNKNIVEIAEENGITITAPCFRNKRKFACCKACVIEVNGIQKYACCTKPQENMEIIYNREDLANIRKERIEDYVQVIKRNKASISNCCCGTDLQNPTTKTASCSCSDSSCCR